MSPNTHPLSIRLTAWVARRYGIESGEVTLNRKRVYILPTRAGLTFALVMLIMLIASINYGLQMGYVLTFLVTSMAVVGLYHTHRNLARISVCGLRASDAFAGDLVGYTLMAVNPTDEARYALSFSLIIERRRKSDYEKGVVRPLPGDIVDLPARGQQEITLGLPTRRRGVRPCPRISIETRFPFGLWTAWAFYTPALTAIVYPTPEDDAPPLPLSAGEAASVHEAGSAQVGEDLAGVRPYQTGDSQQRIAWRLAARSDELSVKIFDAPGGGELILDWDATADLPDTEQRLSRLARWVLDADAAHMRYGLNVPGTRIALGTGADHRNTCLRALALVQV